MNLPASSQLLLSDRNISQCRASLEIAGVCPTCDVSYARPLTSRRMISTWLPSQAPRSALVVSHHLNGLLRTNNSRILRLVPHEVRYVSGQSNQPFLPPPQASLDDIQYGCPALSSLPISRQHQSRPSPQRVSHPSKNTLRRKPHRISAAVTLLPFHRPDCISDRGLATSATRSQRTETSTARDLRTLREHDDSRAKSSTKTLTFQLSIGTESGIAATFR